MACDFQSELQRVHQSCLPLLGKGTVADYIPELARVNPRQFGICLHTIDGQTYGAGDINVPFSIQSISKVIVLAMVLPRFEKSLARVHVEPSGDPFNSLVQLEFEEGIPRNPFINAGALVTTDILMSLEEEPKKAVLDFISTLCGGAGVDFNAAVARSELGSAARNRSLAFLMQSFGNLNADVEALLDVYCHHCSIQMTLT